MEHGYRLQLEHMAWKNLLRQTQRYLDRGRCTASLAGDMPLSFHASSPHQITRLNHA